MKNTGSCVNHVIYKFGVSRDGVITYSLLSQYQSVVYGFDDIRFCSIPFGCFKDNQMWDNFVDHF